MTLKYAIIGSGMMGQEHIRNIKLIDDARVVAIAEPDAGMREASLALIGDGLEVFTDASALVSGSDADAFVVAAPNFTHAGIVEALVPLGKPILVEKPVVTDMAQARRLRDLAAQATAPIWVAMEYRYMPAVSTLVEEVHRGVMGRLVMLSIVERRFPFLVKVNNWNRFNAFSGGTLVEKCCHFFDLMRLLTRSEPIRIYAVGGQAHNHRDETYDGRVPDILDNAYVTVEFADGVNAMLELCMFAEGARFQERVSVIGTRSVLEARVPGPGRFEVDGVNKAAEYVRADRDRRVEEVEVVEVEGPALAAGDHHGATYYQHKQFADLVRDGGKPVVSVDDGLTAVAMGLAAQASIARREPVDMAEFAI